VNIKTTYHKLQKYIHNTAWIMGEKVAAMGIGFLVTVLLARYLGPENFGVYSYAISLTSLFAAAGHMGLSGLVVREIVKKPNERALTLGTTFALKLIGMAFGYALLLVYAFVFEGAGSVEFVVLAIAGAALLFKPFDVIDFWFQAFVQARFIAMARLSALLISSAAKIILVLFGFGVVYLVAANMLQAMLAAVALVLLYKLKTSLQLSHWSMSWRKAKELFGQGWVIYLGSIFAVIYLKVDQIMLRWLLGPESVGVYAVAAQLSEAWYFVPTAIVASFFPKLIKLREQSESLFNQRLQQLFDMLFILALVVAVIVTLLDDAFIALFFGPDYAASASVLTIHIWAALFIFMRAAFSKWILIENVLVFSLITQGVGAMLNVVLNFLLIPIYGVQGAAVATLISYAFASFFSLIIYEKTRPVFVMMLKSFVAVVRYALGRKFI
jgi:O-antigen/teichoic acid export membrane protein